MSSLDKRVLGKGLGALLPPEKKPETDIKTLPITKIQLNKQQPRKDYDQKKLDELKQSIQENGILQPILVRKIDDDYEVIAGERRLRAAQQLALQQVPVVIKEYSDQQAFVISLIENIQREDLNPVEEAQAYERLIKEYGLTHDQLSQSVGKNRSTISNSLRLLKLPLEIIEWIHAGNLSEGHARCLVPLEYDQQINFAKKIIDQQLSVRQVESLLKDNNKIGTKKNPVKKDIEIQSVESELQQFLGTKVEISKSRKKGKLSIEFYSWDDLERITKIIKQ